MTAVPESDDGFPQAVLDPRVDEGGAVDEPEVAAPAELAVEAEGSEGAEGVEGAEGSDETEADEAAAEQDDGDEAEGPAAAARQRAADEPFYPTFSVVDLLSIHTDLPSQFPVVTLQESEPPYRQISFPVGLPEGVALSYAFRRMDTPRPLTHELFASVLQRLHSDVIAVRLIGRTGGNYLAELEVMGTNGREVFPCRPTDGITLALRVPVPAPVLADVRLLEESGDVSPDGPE